MAGSSLLTLLDDIASVLDDVATLTQLATKKTAGVLGDDLALNAEQVTGVSPERELPVVWRVAKGSAVNKLILVPAALAVSAFASWLIVPLLMVGGAFLCFEGFEKVAHKLLHGDAEDERQHAAHMAALAAPDLDMVAYEREKIRGAVRTDFILSAEIVVITLGSVADAALLTRVMVMFGVAALMTVGVYGLVAAIVKLDDLGLKLEQSPSGVRRGLGRGLVRGAPWLMKLLSVAGTLAMFLVGGGILVHGVQPLHHLGESLAAHGGALGVLASAALSAGVGVLSGALLVGALSLGKRLLPAR